VVDGNYRQVRDLVREHDPGERVGLRGRTDEDLVPAAEPAIPQPSP